jgi:hypothetical protein
VLNRGSRVSLFTCPVVVISLYRVQPEWVSTFEEMMFGKPASIRNLIVTIMQLPKLLTGNNTGTE